MAKHLLGLQPLSIRKLLLKNEELRKGMGLQPEARIKIGDRFSVSSTKLFAATRQMLVQGHDERLASAEGGEVIIGKGEGSIYLQITQREGETVRVPMVQLGMLSSDREERIQALDQCLREIGPTGPEFSTLRSAALERELSDGEVGELLDALWSGVSGLQARIHARLAAGDTKLWDLVPDSLDYFELFCGPDPGDLEPEEYLGSVLPHYRMNLLRRDLNRGLEICLAGALRDDLCPGAWLESIGDDELWGALEACQPKIEPFSLLGALDIALYRQHDERFRALAEEAVTLLTEEQFKDDGFDLYQLLPSLAQFALNRIQVIENGALMAPFWKRMCAWMQTGQVIRLLIPFGVDFENLHHQLESNLLAAGRLANILDLRKAPLYQAGELSVLSLQCEVIRRLLHLEVRHGAAGRVVPSADRIKRSAVRISEKSGLPLFLGFPGPLEGHILHEDTESLLEKEQGEKLLNLPPDLLLSNMVYLSQLFRLNMEARSVLREMISNNALGEGLALEERLARLGNAGLVAAAERDGELAKAIADAVLSQAHSLQESSAVSLGFQSLLIASAAFEEESSWAGWLKERLAELAELLPAGKASTKLYCQLQELDKVVKLGLDVTNRAKALASAAASFLE